MLVQLFVKRVINKQNSFYDVPNQLKNEVAVELIKKGYGDLIPSDCQIDN